MTERPPACAATVAFGPFLPVSPSAARPTSLALADLKGDGRLDVVAAGTVSPQGGTGAVSVLLGRGDGTFAAKIDYAEGATPVDQARNRWKGSAHYRVGTGGLCPTGPVAGGFGNPLRVSITVLGRGDRIRTCDILLPNAPLGHRRGSLGVARRRNRAISLHG